MFAGKLRRFLGYAAFTGVLATPIAAWLISVGNPLEYFAYDLPPGQALYIGAKIAGLLAFFMLWIQCILGLVRRAPVLNGFPPIEPQLHRFLGLVTLLLALIHVGCFFGAASLRAGSPAWSLFWPNFSHGYFNAFVSVGLIALWCLLLGIFAGWRTSRGDRRWRGIHMAWSVVFVLVFLHTYTIGSESRFGAMRYVLLFMGASLLLVALSRLMASVQGAKAAHIVSSPQAKLGQKEA